MRGQQSRHAQPTAADRREITGDQRGTLLSALEDADCRAIMEATAAEPLSASELSDRCDLPQSTTYRKLDLLTECGLLRERIRLSRSGKHTNEYVLAIEDVTVSMDAEDGVTVDVAPTERTETAGGVLAGAD